jgi:tetratricopeptide (TPR) repeat protein
MSTKSKTAGSTLSVPERPLEALFSEALALINENQHDKAITALESLVAEAKARGQVGLARSAGNRLAALRARSENKADVSVDPVLEAQICLNRGASDQALELVDKALKADGRDARLYYLKAIAHAQKEEAESAAAAAKQAIALNQELMHQYRLEKDFDRVRSSSAFVSLGMD